MSRRNGVKRFAEQNLETGGLRPAVCVKCGAPAGRDVPWGGKQQVIYKHAISTIAPARSVDLAETEA